MIYWETENMLERPGEMEYGKDIINKRHTKNRKDCRKTEDCVNHTVKLRSNYWWWNEVSSPAAIQICIKQQRRENFKYCQLVDNGDVVTATKTESFNLKLQTEELTEGALSFIITAYRSIIISSKNDTSFVATGKKFTTDVVRALPQQSDFPSERIYLWTMLTEYWEQ